MRSPIAPAPRRPHAAARALPTPSLAAPAAWLLGSLLALAACGRPDGHARGERHGGAPGAPAEGGAGVRVALGEATRDSATATRLGADDVEVRSTDGTVLMAVVGDSVRVRLSDSLRAAVRQEVRGAIPGDTADAGLGALVGRVVARSVDAAVGTAMGTVVRIPVAEVREARCDDGRLHFRTRDGKDGRIHVNVGGDRRGADRPGAGRGGRDGDDGLRFTPADCRLFVDALARRQGASAEAW